MLNFNNRWTDTPDASLRFADEFAAKFWLIVDSIRYHRSDSSLVKIVVPVRNGDTDAATKVAIEFAQAMFPAISRQLPRAASRK